MFVDMEDAGASAIVLTSLFEEQLALESRTLDEDLSRGTDSFAESLGYLPDLDDYRMTHEIYLENLRPRPRSRLHSRHWPVSTAQRSGGWVRFAKEMEQAGAHAIELNTYALATDGNRSSADIEEQLLDLVAQVCEAVNIPVAVKLSQSFTSIPHLAARLEEAGAAAFRFSTASISPTSISRRWKCGPRCISPRRRSCCRGCIGRRFFMGR